MEALLTAFVNAVIQQGFASILLTLILVGGYRRWWVWGWQLKEAETRSQKWEDIALRAMNVAGRSASVVGKVVQQQTEGP